jgi:hypothetical protein
MSSKVTTALLSMLELRSQIQTGEYKQKLGSATDWGGADLIVKPVEIDRKHLEGKTIVVTEFSRELSWLIGELRGVCSPFVDYLSKFHFYPRLGSRANEFLSSEQVLNEPTGLLIAVLDEAESFVRESD